MFITVTKHNKLLTALMYKYWKKTWKQLLSLV